MSLESILGSSSHLLSVVGAPTPLDGEVDAPAPSLALSRGFPRSFLQPSLSEWLVGESEPQGGVGQ